MVQRFYINRSIFFRIYLRHPGIRYTRKLAPITPATRRIVNIIPFLVILFLFRLILLLLVNLFHNDPSFIYIIKRCFSFLDVSALNISSKICRVFVIILFPKNNNSSACIFIICQKKIHLS